MASDLVSLLKEIPVPETESESGLTFSALPIPGCEPHRLGRNVNGEPALLVASGTTSDYRSRPPSIQLEHIAVQHEVTCRVTSPEGQTQESPFTVIQLQGSDFHLRSYFLRIGSSLLASLGPTPTPQDLHKAVHGLVELFRAITRPALRSVQGLWSELFVIAIATNAVTLAGAWHVSPEDRYDFHGGKDRIEVKSSSGRTRRHRFSLEQLLPPSGTRLMIASVLLEQSSGGMSLRKLIDRVHQRLKPDPGLQAHIDRVIAETLGESLLRALDVRYDWELAWDTFAFFPHEMVPSLVGPIPGEISDISFVSDLSGLKRADYSMMNGEFFSAAWPLAQ
jgi:Putative  PD-(D/E)XK family member, (DUF4420)